MELCDFNVSAREAIIPPKIPFSTPVELYLFSLKMIPILIEGLTIHDRPFLMLLEYQIISPSECFLDDSVHYRWLSEPFH